VGPHRDDLEICSDGYEIAKYGSSGQQRSALLILDLAQLSVYHTMFDEYPVFLIDDIDAELDRERIGILLDYLEGKAQTLVSTSKRWIADRYRARARTICVVAGQATEDRELIGDAGQHEPALATSTAHASEPATQPVAQLAEMPAPPQAEPLDWLRQDAPAETASSDDDEKHRAPF